MKRVLGNMVLDQADHCGRGGQVNMVLNLSFLSQLLSQTIPHLALCPAGDVAPGW